MPDISKCGNPEKCKRRNECYRYTSEPSPYQSYSNFMDENGVCDALYPNKGYRIDKKG